MWADFCEAITLDFGKIDVSPKHNIWKSLKDYVNSAKYNVNGKEKNIRICQRKIENPPNP